MIAVPAGELTPLVCKYVSEQVGAKLDADLSSAMAVLNDDGDFVAGVVFSEYRDTDVQLSTAAETPLAWRDSILRAVFDYVFNQLGCVRCTAITKKGNRKARAFLEHLGFQLEGNMRLGYDGTKDALIYGLLASECRYLAPPEEPEDGQEIEGQAADATEPDADSGGAVEDEYRHGGGEREPEPDQSVHSGGVARVPADWY